MDDRRVDAAFWALRIGLGATAFVAGLDKFTNLLTDWEHYLSPAISRRVPISPKNFMRLAGIIETIVGAGILSGKTRVGGYVAGAWLASIAAQCMLDQDWYDIAARDFNMAIGAVTLALLTEIREKAAHGEQNLEHLRRAA